MVLDKGPKGRSLIFQLPPPPHPCWSYTTKG